jgi:hypothetical protein
MTEPSTSPLVEELTALLGVAQEWVGRTADAHQVATGAAECVNCPVCRLIGVLRGDRPELTERTVEAVSTVVTALRTVFGPPANDAEAATAPTVQPIRVDFVDDEA